MSRPTPRSASAVALLGASTLILAACGASDDGNVDNNKDIDAVDTGIYGLQAAGPGNDPTHLTEGLDAPMTEYYALASPEVDKDSALEWYKEKYDDKDAEDLKFLGSGEKKETGMLGAWCWSSPLDDEETEDTFLSLQLFDNSVIPKSDQEGAGSDQANPIKEGVTTEIYSMTINSSAVQGDPADICRP